MPIEYEKPWWVLLIERFTDWECMHLTPREMRFRRMPGRRARVRAAVRTI